MSARVLDVLVDDGVTLHMRVHEGPGATVVLLHDLDCSGPYWDAVVARLLELDPDLRIVVPDLRGHGASGIREEPSRKRLVKDLKRSLKELGVDEPVVCGHGWGADLALAFDAAAGVVAVNPLLGRPPAAFDAEVPRPDGMAGAVSADALHSCIVGATTAKPLRRGRRDAPLLLIVSREEDMPALEGSDVLEHAHDVQAVQCGSRHLPVELPNAVAALVLYWIEETA